MSASQCSFNANLKTRLKFKSLWCKLTKSFHIWNRTLLESISLKNQNFRWHFFQTFFFFTFVLMQKAHDIPEGLFISPHNHKLLTEFILFDFAKEILKIFQSLVFLLCNICTFDTYFLKSVFKSGR